MAEHPVAEQRYVLRPAPHQSAAVQALAGAPVYAVGSADRDGMIEVTLHDGTRVHVTRAEVVAESRL